MNVPDAVAELVVGSCVPGRTEQVFTLLTVDTAGFSHTCLLSRTELAATEDRSRICVVVRGSTTRANLRRTSRAALVVVAGTTHHLLKMDVVALRSVGSMLGVTCRVRHHRTDDMGLPLLPFGFVPGPELAEMESWADVEEVLDALLAEGGGGGPVGSRG